MTKASAFVRWIGSSLKSQWLASTLLVPIALLAVQNHYTSKEAKEARAKAVAVDRLAKLQSSGKDLDSAVAGYFQAIAELALSERHIKAPGSYDVTPISRAQTGVVEARLHARKALETHAGDVQSLHGSIDGEREAKYMASLADIQGVVERDAAVGETGRNINALGKLVVARNALVDQAMGKAI